MLSTKGLLAQAAVLDLLHSTHKLQNTQALWQEVQLKMLLGVAIQRLGS